MTPARIAVVVPAHNEEALLPACLRSVLAATTPVPVEVVVVADACTDDTAALASAAGATVITLAARNVGRARAAGMEHALRSGADGLWLATTDADSRVPANWLRRHLVLAGSGADLVAVHWRWPVAEHFRPGDAVHAALAARPGLTRLSRLEEDDFLLEVFTRVPPLARSVAQRENLA